jgi:hypothetical protein
MNLNAAIRRQAAPNRLPLTGYFQYTLGSGRTVKLYIASGAPIRTYFTIIGVPNGVDTKEFLTTAGWFDYADDREEALLVLEPAARLWSQDADIESAYIRDAIAWLNSTQVNGTAVFSTFGEWYFVGYGAIAAQMEIWAANNPTRVIAQAYVDGPGADRATLTAAGALTYGVGAQTPNGDSAGFNSATTIRYDETPIPTYYVIRSANTAQITDSLNYWNTVNDVASLGATVGAITTYNQNLSSTRPATEYWNNKLSEGLLSSLGIVSDSSVGIVKTVVNSVPPSGGYPGSEFDADYSNYTKPITDFLTWYTRYENTNGYANFLAPRADYAALGIQVREAYISNATNSRRRQYSLHAPPGLPASPPLLIVLPGNSQTNKVYMDATQWWYVAAKEKFLLAVLNEDYNSGWTTVSHYDNDLVVLKVLDTLIAEFGVDEERVYVTGQSAGSGATQTIGINIPERFAAVASTSMFASPSGGAILGSNIAIPAFVQVGEGDMTMCAGGVWGDPSTSPKGQTLSAAGLGWANYHLANWGFTPNYVSAGTAPTTSTSDLTYYQSTTTYGSTDDAHTYQTWTWNKDVSGTYYPVLRYGKTDDRPHNCYTSEMQQLWDFLKCYKVDVNNDRYYSSSGFVTSDDAVKIN